MELVWFPDELEGGDVAQVIAVELVGEGAIARDCNAHDVVSYVDASSGLCAIV